MNRHLAILYHALQWFLRHLLLAFRSHGRLLRRTFLVAILLVNGGLIVSGSIELYFRHQESVLSVHRLQQEMAKSAAFKIQQYIESITQTLRTVSQTPEMMSHGLSENYRFQLAKLIRVFPSVTTVTAIDAAGNEQVKESRVALIRTNELSNRSTDKAFIQAQAGISYFGEVYFVRQSEPYIRIAVPIEIYAGKVIGVIIAEVNLKYIWEVIANIHVGETGYAYVVTSQGDLIAHPDSSLALQNQNLSHLTQVQKALRGEASLATLHNLYGENVFATFTSIPILGWVVIVERLADEAYGPTYTSLGLQPKVGQIVADRLL